MPNKMQDQKKEAPAAIQKPQGAELEKLLVHTAEAPQIKDTLAKAKAAVAQAQKAKQKRLQMWACTECGDHGIQLYLDGENRGHFHVALEDGVPVNTAAVGSDKPKLRGAEKASMDMAMDKKAKGHKQGGIVG